MSSAKIDRGTTSIRNPEIDLSLGALPPSDPASHAIRAADPCDRRRVPLPPTGTSTASIATLATRPSRLAISIALVGSSKAGLLSLPDRRLDELTTLGAHRAADVCRTHGIRLTFLVPGAHVDRHVGLLQQLAEVHEIGLYGFDPTRAGPDDPLRARDRLAATTGFVAHWYAPPFQAPASPAWIEAAGLRRVPPETMVGIGPLRVPLARALRSLPPIAPLLLRQALSTASSSERGSVSGKTSPGHRAVGNTSPDSLCTVHLPLLAGSFARAAAWELPDGLIPPAALDLASLARAASLQRTGDALQAL